MRDVSSKEMPVNGRNGYAKSMRQEYGRLDGFF